jgi:hypothetical protein
MHPSARHTPVVAPCSATSPRSATERWHGSVAQHPISGCAAPTLGRNEKVAEMRQRNAQASNLPAPILQQCARLILIVDDLLPYSKHANLSSCFHSGFLDLGLKVSASSELAACN